MVMLGCDYVLKHSAEQAPDFSSKDVTARSPVLTSDPSDAGSFPHAGCKGSF